MKKVIIENWQMYGDYLLFANFVDKVGEWIMLEATSEKIIAYGKERSMLKFTDILTDNQIPFEMLGFVQ